MRDFTEERLWSLFFVSTDIGTGRACRNIFKMEELMEPSFIYEAKDQTLIIHLPKELDHHNCRNLKYETDLLMAENYISRIIFDFTRTQFMDSSGIGILLNRYKQMKSGGGRTAFYGAGPQVMRVLKIAGIPGLMSQYDSKEAALFS